MVAFTPGTPPTATRIPNDTNRPPPSTTLTRAHTTGGLSNTAPRQLVDRGARDLDQLLAGGTCVKSYEGTSQYAQRGISSCGLASFNAVKTVFNLERNGCTGVDLLTAMMKKELAEETIEICSLWTSSAHLEVEEIHEMPLFQHNLKIVDNEYDQAVGDNFIKLLHHLRELSLFGKSAAAIITKPPEIVTVFSIETGLPTRPNVFVVFDSHSRPDLHPQGAAFIFFGTLREAGRYLTDLLSVDPSIFKDTRMQWQAQLLAQYTAHYMVATTDVPSPNTILYEANIALLEYKPNLASLQEKVTETSTENNHLKNEIAALKEQTKELTLARDRFSQERNALEEEIKAIQQQRRSLEYDVPRQREDRPPHAQPERHLIDKWRSKGKGKERHTSDDGQASYSSYSQTLQNKWHRPWGSNSSRSQQSTPSYRNQHDDDRPPSPDYSHRSVQDEYPRPRSTTSTASTVTNSPGYSTRYDAPKHNKPTVPGGYVDDSYQVDTDHMMALRLQEEMREQEMMDAQFAAVAQAAFDAEHRRLQEEHLRVVRSAPLTFDCGICMETLPADSVAEVDPCDHQFCRSCLLQHVTSSLNQGKFPISCPGCAADSSSRDVSFISRPLAEILGLSEEESQKWWRLELTGLTAILDCRKCNQSNLVDKGDHDAAEILTCPNFQCSYTFCKKCSQEVPGGDASQHSCDGTKELDSLMRDQGWKHCPGCRTPVERTYGCNHMTCGAPGCNTHFCYVDGAKIITSANPREVKTALDTHYQQCALFEVPAE